MQGYPRQSATVCFSYGTHQGERLRKSKKVFDNSKVTDHHAIIPTGQPVPTGLSIDEKHVFHTIALRFISVFFPDCLFEQTQVKAHAGKTQFKASGKVITDPGWKRVYDSGKETACTCGRNP